MKSCNVDALDAKIADVRRTHKPLKRFKPLFEHVLKLAADSARRGYCTRAGREIKHAKKVAGYR
jgi:hypothetical protein